jgi:ubiquinone/menaquinone biosynthesis C-methylase UbiE
MADELTTEKMPAGADRPVVEHPLEGSLIGINDQFARRFRRRVWLDYRGVIRRTLDEADFKPGERVLDITSDDASLALQMLSRVAPGQVVCVCPIEATLQQAYRQAQAAKLEEHLDWRIAAVEQLPFPDESFDAITCGLSFRLVNATAFITEAHRLLVDGGRLILTESLIPPSRLNHWRLAWRSFYYRYIGRSLAEAAADFYSADELADRLHRVGFQPIIIRGLQKPRTRHSWVFSLIKAMK